MKQSFHKWLWLLLIGLLASCAVPRDEPSLTTPTPVNSGGSVLPSALYNDQESQTILSQVSLARGYLTTPNELRLIALKAQQGVYPYSLTVSQVLQAADQLLTQDPIQLPQQINIRSSDIEDPKELHKASQALSTWAMAYNLTRDDEPERAEAYAQAAYVLLMQMPNLNTTIRTYESNTRLNIATHLQHWVYAGDLLADWQAPGGSLFAESTDAIVLKQWLANTVVRYAYEAAYSRTNNWGNWGRLTAATIADYVGGITPLQVPLMRKNSRGAYERSGDLPCDGERLSSCQALGAAQVYREMLQLHFEYVNGNLLEFSRQSCDASGSKSMIRPDGGIPDELRRSEACDATSLGEPYGAASRYSQFALDAMVSLAELAWRRGDASLYLHIDPTTQRGSLARALSFLIDRGARFEHGAILEIANRFYGVYLQMQPDTPLRGEIEALLSRDLATVLQQQGSWPLGVQWIMYGSLTHSHAPDTFFSPPMILPRS
jgi:hypothetical protein